MNALTSLQTILHQRYHPPEQLQQVRDQVSQLRESSKPPQPVMTVHTIASPSQYVNAQPNRPPSGSGTAQIPLQPSTPSPTDIQAFMSSKNLASIIANVQRAPTTTSTAQDYSSQPVTDNGASNLLASLRKAGILGASPGNATQMSNFGTPPSSAAPLQIASLVNDVQLTSASLKM